MQYIQNLKIRHKLLILTSINILFFIITGFFSYQALSLLGDSQEKLITNTNVLYHQMNADMMHDALRADVYKALFVYNSNKNIKETLLAEFSEHKEIFFKSLQELSQYSINDTIDQAVIQVIPALQNYSQQSEKIITMAVQSMDKNPPLIGRELAEFSRAFDELADKMSLLSALISTNSTMQKASANRLVWINKSVVISIILLCVFCIWYISNKIANQLTGPILQAKEAIMQLAQGNLPALPESVYKDEISEMMHSLQILTNNLSDIKGFANEVGQGKFDSEIMVFHNTGQLGTALVTMCKSLQTIAEKETNQRWINAGLTEANDILRHQDQAQSKILNQILRFFIHYLQGNQGCISLLNNENPTDPHLRVHACYAFGRKKYLNKRLELDEGLPCRVLQEGDPLYLTDIPRNYIHISSGLGTAPPQSILVLPLKVDQEIIGVLEIASIHVLPPHYLEFAERLSVMVAQYISTDNKNARTVRLLDITQQQKAEIQAQEEEVRQNMEELYATQEELRRREHLYLERIAELEIHLNLVSAPTH